MPLLDDRVQKQVRTALAALTSPVRLVMFTQREGGALECAFCGETRQLVEEIAGLSDKIRFEVRDFQADNEQARGYAIDKIPAIAVLADGDTPRDYGIRFYGIPSGYEFSTFLEDLRMVSRGDAGLGQATRDAIAKLTQPVHIQVFVTPT
jgi:glutaredoxin-like protein